MTRQGVTLTLRNCAVCGSTRKKLLFEQKFTTVGLLEGYNVVVCEQCGFAFADHLPGQADFDRYYRDLSKYEYQHRDGKESSFDEARLHEIAAALSGLIPNKEGRILEIGCSTGLLLSLLKAKGYSNVWGLDPSPVCAASAQELYGVTVFTKPLSDLAKSQERFDFLLLVGVLEHIRNLEEALGTLHQVLSKSARVYLDVPDATEFASVPDAPFQQFSMEHINFFSEASLANLMRSHGFECVFSQKVMRQYTAATTMPSVHAVFENREGTSAVPARDTQTEERLREYIRQSRAVDERLRSLIDRTQSNRESIIVWGVGTHTQRLLATGGLDPARICAFVDSNPKYHGKQLNDIPIVSPESLKNRHEPILICSKVFQQEIQDQIHEKLGLSNEILLLY